MGFKMGFFHREKDPKPDKTLRNKILPINLVMYFLDFKLLATL